MVVNQLHSNAVSHSEISTRTMRVVAGLGLVLHALFHTTAGMMATSAGRPAWVSWAWTAVWTIAAGALVGAAYGVWRWRPFSLRLKPLALVGSSFSLLLLFFHGQWWSWLGSPIDLLVLYLVAFLPASSPAKVEPKRRVGAFLARAAASFFLMYGMAIIATRPWHQNWGATPAEINLKLPGDLTHRDNFINHVVAIDAPAEKVWPYLVQIGQDKAGFYSYDWLERAFGDDVHNEYEIRPEWQGLKVGDAVRLTQPNYLGGLVPEGVPLKVLAIDKNRRIELEQWGTFWIEPVTGGRCRLGIRSGVTETPFWATPLMVFAFEPAHFIMEQRMLRTIKALAEQP